MRNLQSCLEKTCFEILWISCHNLRVKVALSVQNVSFSENSGKCWLTWLMLVDLTGLHFHCLKVCDYLVTVVGVQIVLFLENSVKCWFLLTWLMLVDLMGSSYADLEAGNVLFAYAQYLFAHAQYLFAYAQRCIATNLFLKASSFLMRELMVRPCSERWCLHG